MHYVLHGWAIVGQVRLNTPAALASAEDRHPAPGPILNGSASAQSIWLEAAILGSFEARADPLSPLHSPVSTCFLS